MFLDLKGSNSLEAIADLIDPVYEILQDKEIADDMMKNRAVMVWVQKMLRNHPEETLKIVRILNCETESYEPSIADIVKTFMKFKNHELIRSLFTLQGQTEEENVSGSAMDNTTE